MIAAESIAAKPQVRIVFVITRLIYILAIGWVTACALAYTFQRKLIYVPDPERVTPEHANLKGVSENVITTPDGEHLVTWWTAPKPGKPVVLYFHGNGGNISWRSGRVQMLQQAGFGVMTLSYRGYGGSTGAPSEAAIIADAQLAYDHLRDKGFGPSQIVLFGESLGSGVAVQLAASRSVAGLVLDSPYSSLTDVASRRFPILPVRLLLQDQFNSMGHIKDVHVPLLIVHGDQDDVVPYDLGRRLFETANEPKKFLTLPGAGHTAPLKDGSWDTIRPFLEQFSAKG